MAYDSRDWPEPPKETEKQRMTRRLAQLKPEREPMESLYTDLAQYFKPSQSRYVLSGAQVGQRNKGSRMNTKVVRNTPFMARRTFIAGMMSGLTSPARPWFRLTTPDPGLAEFGPVKSWLYVVEQRIREVFAKGNLYNALPVMYGNLGTFGTAAMLALDDDEDVVRFYPKATGTYWLAQSNRLKVDTLYEQYPMTVRQLVQEFGFDRVSSRTKAMARNGQWEQWIDVLHCIEPNDERLTGAIGAKGMPIRSIYIEMGCDDNDVLARRGFSDTSALIAPRWELDAEDVYGSDCPGMIALGPAKALMVQERRKAQAIDKLVAPPLLAPVGLRNQLIENVAGGITYYDVQQGREGVKSLYDVKPDINALREDIQATGREVEDAFYTDMFLAITNMEGVQPRNQFELIERKEEKLLQLGPALERLNDEALDPIIDRTFSVMVRRSQPYWEGRLEGQPILPPPPPELAGTDLTVDYISILAQAMKAVGISSLDRTISFTGNLAALKQDPSVWDKIDADQAIDEMSSMLGTSPLVVRSDEAVEQLRQSRAKQAQMAQLAQGAEVINSVSQSVKNLADSPVSAENALGKISGA